MTVHLVWVYNPLRPDAARIDHIVGVYSTQGRAREVCTAINTTDVPWVAEDEQVEMDQLPLLPDEFEELG